MCWAQRTRSAVVLETYTIGTCAEVDVRSIDIHAHLTPQCFIRAMQAGKAWHGIQPGTMCIAFWVVSTGAAFYYYDGEAIAVAAMHRECNDEVHQMTVTYPDRFKGLAQIPMQDPTTAIAELDRAVNQLGLVGAMINDTANGRTYDEPEFLPLWKAAEQMGALMFIHQQGGDTLVTPRLNR